MIAFQDAPAALPPGRRVYAVGDVHGCLDQLERLHAAIAADLADRPCDSALLIHLGDYVDRGMESAGVVERLARLPPPAPGLEIVNLMGNHEAMMLDALAANTAGAAAVWLANGGVETLHSWGVPRGATPAQWRAHVPEADLAFLRALPGSHREGGYLFAHAGIRPGVALEDQTQHDLLWIREPFLSWKGELPAVVVHGHTPRPEPVLRPNRIGIDTGAALGGHLTCLVLQDATLGFIQI
ncbi:MAG: serine/threonine protein phosphatase [Rhodospirillales bacterium]|nr:serine/threonine protein phosphatase [Rhodospirillales bacterium]